MRRREQSTKGRLREVDLHGMRVEDALRRLDKFLDDAIVAGARGVRINHGKGTGALRNEVHAYLKKHPQVRSFDFAPACEGGEGVTVVYFK